MMSHGATVLRCLICRKATSAVEVAIIFSLFLTMLFGIIAFRPDLAVAHDVQQLTAEAARAAVASLDDGERQALAQNDIAANVGAHRP